MLMTSFFGRLLERIPITFRDVKGSLFTALFMTLMPVAYNHLTAPTRTITYHAGLVSFRSQQSATAPFLFRYVIEIANTGKLDAEDAMVSITAPDFVMLGDPEYDQPGTADIMGAKCEVTNPHRRTISFRRFAKGQSIRIFFNGTATYPVQGGTMGVSLHAKDFEVERRSEQHPIAQTFGVTPPSVHFASVLHQDQGARPAAHEVITREVVARIANEPVDYSDLTISRDPAPAHFLANKTVSFTRRRAKPTPAVQYLLARQVTPVAPNQSFSYSANNFPAPTSLQLVAAQRLAASQLAIFKEISISPLTASFIRDGGGTFKITSSVTSDPSGAEPLKLDDLLNKLDLKIESSGRTRLDVAIHTLAASCSPRPVCGTMD